ncbi:hypothetical protein Poly41_37620 [Novipirellula artificiosorum]|uniref:3-keto-alpha-glucoside-1,2-lyase/3-keto-2-hydroxy-glucal hydratase domain-containing protein n=2 Tax=Novipirellula artificiosorum TaxID=2528016 RepID=A0A5C6DGR3_9BACT|nr:hypothetical protein Poly41_37620 [Novipirellula artificiosorum]
MRCGVFFAMLILTHDAFGEEPGRFKYEYPGYNDTPFYPATKFYPAATYRVHDPNQPQPPRVLPPNSDGSLGTPAPSDAVVLFDGTSLDAFEENDAVVENGVIVIGGDSLLTKQAFGSCQLHLEWRTPETLADRTGNMGNSGLFLMDQYELQIFDSYSCKIYADGSAGAIYAQTPPLVNVCRKPGEWQSFDVVFHAPVFQQGEVVSLPEITVLHNGVLIQDRTQIKGPTLHKTARPITPHAEKMPLHIQGHGCPVGIRNFWIRPLD